MVPVTSLWLPILVSAVLVFIASSIIHMALPYHRSDHGKVPAEDEVMAALRRFNIPPGDYVMPCPGTPAAMRSPEFIDRMKRGPVGILTFREPGPPAMGKNLALWFLYCVIVGVFSAYITGRALAPGAEYLNVFRFVGTTAFMGYSLAVMHQSIWWSKAWSSTLKTMFDGLLYALLTAGAFGWLWPG